MDLFKLLHRIVKAVLCIYCPLQNKTKLKFVQDFKACLSFSFGLKVLIESKYSMPLAMFKFTSHHYNFDTNYNHSAMRLAWPHHLICATALKIVLGGKT